MAEAQSRGTPRVEIVVKTPKQAASGPGRLRKSIGFGFVGAVLLIGVATAGGGFFLPWFSTSAEALPRQCEPHMEFAVGEALSNLTTTQGLAALIGFVVFTVIGFLRMGAKGDESGAATA